MTRNPAQDVATILAAAGIGLTLGTNLFLGTPRDSKGNVSDDVVFVLGGPGARPERTMGEASEIRTPIASVRLRYRKFQDGDTKARAVMDALRAATIVGYLDIRATQSEPLTLGNDGEGRHWWSISYELVYEDAA